MAILEETHQPRFSTSTGGALQPRVFPTVKDKLNFLFGLSEYTPRWRATFVDILSVAFEPKRPDAEEATQGMKKIMRDVSVADVLLEHAEVYDVPHGTVIFQEGSFGEHLFLLLSGQVELCTNIILDIGQEKTVTLEDLGPGDMFGEMSVLSMNAHLCTATALEPTSLLLIPQFIVQEFMAPPTKSDARQRFGPFRAQMSETYIARTVTTLLRRVRVLQDHTAAEIEALIPAIEMQTFGAGEIFYEEGETADNVYIVHQGWVKIVRNDNGTQRILSYIAEGDCFGEFGVLLEQSRMATAVAMYQTEVLVIPAKDFQAAVWPKPEAMRKIAGLKNQQLLDGDMADVTTFRVQRQMEAEVSPNLDVLAIDETLCIRCDNCVNACAAAHDDGISRLIRKGTLFEEVLIPTACRFCQDPVCLLCKSGGIKRDKDGDIYFTDSCIGCSGCAQRCPYGNIIMVEREDLLQQPRLSLAQQLLQKVWSKQSDEPESEFQRQLRLRPQLTRLPVKCDLDKGHAFPACVSSCPTQAIKRFRADELDDIIMRAKTSV